MTVRRYEIMVGGELSPRFGFAFEGMTMRSQAGRTLISGGVCDQAQLHGLIDRVGELGLELLAVRIVEGTNGATRSGTRAPGSQGLTAEPRS